MMDNSIKNKIIKNLPTTSGVYIFKNKSGEIIYIGKAKNIKKRVLSYFSKENQTPKTAVLVKKIAIIDTIITDNEYEALLLESSLIKQYYPKYNVQLKDASKQKYVLITDEKFPRLLIVRRNREGKIIGPKGRVYGPFIYGEARSLFIRDLRKIFKIRICGARMPKKVCLQYYLGNCDGPCENKVSKEEYNKNILKVEEILQSQEKLILYIEKLKEEMKKEAQEMNYEKALNIRKKIEALENLLNKQKIEKTDEKNEDYIFISQEKGKVYVQVWRMIRGVIRDREKFSFDITQEDPIEEFLKNYYQNNFIPKKIYIEPLPKEKELIGKYLSYLAQKQVQIIKGSRTKEAKDIIELIAKNVQAQKAKGGIDISIIKMQKVLGLLKPPIIIESIDISNLRDEAIVGSVIRFENAEPKKEDYRRYKIKWTEKQNDFFAIYEVVYRRYKRLKLENKNNYPDLILIDGGLNQLNAAKKALTQVGLDIPLFSFEKQNELVYDAKTLKPIQINKNSDEFLLLKKCISQAHRFALEYNRKIRSKKIEKFNLN
jgi:excinuclease ABC subunit C